MGWQPTQMLDVPNPQLIAALMYLHGEQDRERNRDRLMVEAVDMLRDLRSMVAQAAGFEIKGEASQQPQMVARGRTVEEFRRGQSAHVQARTAESYLEHKREVIDAAA